MERVDNRGLESPTVIELQEFQKNHVWQYLKLMLYVRQSGFGQRLKTETDHDALMRLQGSIQECENVPALLDTLLAEAFIHEEEVISDGKA